MSISFCPDITRSINPPGMRRQGNPMIIREGSLLTTCTPPPAALIAFSAALDIRPTAIQWKVVSTVVSSN